MIEKQGLVENMHKRKKRFCMEITQACVQQGNLINDLKDKGAPRIMSLLVDDSTGTRPQMNTPQKCSPVFPLSNDVLRMPLRSIVSEV